MESLYLDPGMNKSEVQKALHQMVSQSGLRDSYVAMVCSRGRPKIQDQEILGIVKIIFSHGVCLMYM